MCQRMERELILNSYKNPKVLTSNDVANDVMLIARVKTSIERFDESKVQLLLNQLVILHEVFSRDAIPVLLEIKMLDSKSIDKLYSILKVLGYDVDGLEFDQEVLNAFSSKLSEFSHYEEIFRSGGREATYE